MLAAEKFSGPIWEPAAGDGAISRVLAAAGYKVISADLNQHPIAADDPVDVAAPVTISTGVDFLLETRADDAVAPPVPPALTGRTEFCSDAKSCIVTLKLADEMVVPANATASAGKTYLLWAFLGIHNLI